jgi:two-component system, NarL family, sensor histidine kinase EvgS
LQAAARVLPPLRAVWRLLLPLAVFALANTTATTTAMAAENSAQSTTAPRVDPLRVVRYGVLASFPPFQIWPAGGVPGGVDLQLVSRIARDAKVAIELVRYTDFTQLEADLRADRIQLASAMARTREREDSFVFTPPYTQVPLGLVTRADQPSGALLPDLAGRSIAVVRAYASQDQADRLFPLASRVVVNTPREGIEAVRSGRADTFLEMLPVVADLIERGKVVGLSIVRRVDAPSGRLHLVLPRSEQALATRIADALQRVPADDIDALIAAWSVRATLSRPRELVLGEAERTQIAAWPRLTVGVVGVEPPFGSRNGEGQPEGLSVDMLRAVFGRLGIQPASYVFLSAQEIIPALAEGRVDVLIGAEESADRMPVLRFVGPFIEYPTVLIGRPDGGAFDLEQLSGRRLALPLASAARPLVESRHPRVEIVDCKGIEDCLGTIRSGAADATLSDVVGAATAMARRPQADLQIIGAEPQLRRFHSLALAERHAALVPLFKTALDVAIEQDLPALKTRWLSRPARADLLRALLRVYGPWVLATLLLLAALVMWHLHRLRAEVARTRQAQQLAERVSAAKSRFTTFLAHEVRNSLHAVVAGTELAQSGARDTHDSAAMQRMVAESARGTLRLLNNLIDRDRLDAGRLLLHPEAAAPTPLLRAVVQEMLPAAELHGQAIALRVPPSDSPRQLDALRLQQVVRNLISNAIKYGRGGPIELELIDDGNEQVLRLEVRDRGRGIEPAAMAQVFEPFRSEAVGETSAGLGLPISRELARLMGGELTLAPREGGGTVARLSVHAPVVAPMTRPAAAALRVLLVEDAEVFGMVLARAFEVAGHRTQLAGSVAEARRALADAARGAAPFDLLLTDINLPDGTGAELLHGVLADSAAPRPALVAMTADRDEPLRRPDHPEPLPAGVLLLEKTGDARALAERALGAVHAARAAHASPPMHAE